MKYVCINIMFSHTAVNLTVAFEITRSNTNKVK